MKKYIFLFILFVGLSSFAHKFYVGIFQIEHNQTKKRVEITCRIFADDLDRALEKKFNKKFYFAEEKFDASQQIFYKNYISDKLKISINNKQQSLEFKSVELKDNVLIGYFVIQNVTKMKSFEISNSALMEIESAQQNIIQFKSGDFKKSLLFTDGNTSGNIQF